MVNQTLPAAQTVLVVDGPVAEAQESVIAEFGARPDFVIVRCATRGGPARACNRGLAHCRQPFVAIMDSDDISVAHRFEVQLARLDTDPTIDVLASWHSEFNDDPRVANALKRSPSDHEQIARALPWRNVLSHPTIVVRRSFIDLVGGYREFKYLQDYDLYLRLLSAGARFAAIQEPLVLVRTTSEQFHRRGGIDHVVSEWRFRSSHFRNGSLGRAVFMTTILSYTLFRLLPNSIRKSLYRFVRAPSVVGQ